MVVVQKKSQIPIFVEKTPHRKPENYLKFLIFRRRPVREADAVSVIQNVFNLTRTVGSAAFELSDTVIFAITIIFTVVNAPCQRHPIDIETLIPVFIFCNILLDSYY